VALSLRAVTCPLPLCLDSRSHKMIPPPLSTGDRAFPDTQSLNQGASWYRHQPGWSLGATRAILIFSSVSVRFLPPSPSGAFFGTLLVKGQSVHSFRFVVVFDASVVQLRCSVMFPPSLDPRRVPPPRPLTLRFVSAIACDCSSWRPGGHLIHVHLIVIFSKKNRCG